MTTRMKLNQKIAAAGSATTTVTELLRLSQNQNAELRRALTQNANLPTDMLQRFAKDHQVSVRIAVAQSKNTTAQILEMLANDDYFLVRRFVASNPNTPLLILQRLAQDGRYEVRLGVTKNPNASLELYRSLLGHLGKSERRRLAGTVQCDQDLLERFAGDPEPAVRRKLSHNPTLTDEMLLWLLEAGDLWVKKALPGRVGIAPRKVYEIYFQPENIEFLPRWAGNFSTPADIISRIFAIEGVASDSRRRLYGDYGSPLADIALNPNTPVDIQLRIAADYPDCRRFLGSNTKASPEVLRILARSDDLLCRLRAAEHPGTPIDILEELVQDPEVGVRECALWNENTPKRFRTETIKAVDEASRIRIRIANDNGTSGEVLQRLSKDENRDVRAAVARNPNTPKEVLGALAVSDDEWLQCQVASNANASPDTLQKLHFARGGAIDKHLAKNSSIGPGLLFELSASSDREILRNIVYYNKSAPVEMLSEIAEKFDKWEARHLHGAIIRRISSTL